MEYVETESSSIVSDPVLTPPPLEEERSEGGPHAISEQVDASIEQAQQHSESKTDEMEKTGGGLPVISEQVDASIAQAQHSESKTDKVEKTLASMATMLYSLAETVKQLRGERDLPMPDGQSTPLSAPDTPLALESANRGEGMTALPPSGRSESVDNDTALQHQGLEMPPSPKGQKDSEPKLSPGAPEIWAGRLCNTMALTRSSIPKFTGESIPAYWEFKRSLLRLFQETDLSQARQLEILVEAYSGPMKDNLRSCLAMENLKAGYERAWALLERRHGNKHIYMKQLTERLLTGQSVSLQNPKTMTKLADDLLICIDGLKAMGQLHQIDNLQTTLALAKRFKGRLLHDYTTKRHEYRKKHGEAPGIEWLAEFVKDMVDMSDDMILESERDQKASTSDSKIVGLGAHKSSDVKKCTTLATVGGDTRKEGETCPVCEREHALQHCQKFLDMSSNQRSTVVRSHFRCFSCLGRNHQMAACAWKERCGIDGCLGSHSRLLHRLITRGPYSDTRRGSRPRGGFARGNTWQLSGSKRTLPGDQPRTDVRNDTKRFRGDQSKERVPSSEKFTDLKKVKTEPKPRGGFSRDHTLVTTNGDPYKWSKMSSNENLDDDSQ